MTQAATEAIQQVIAKLETAEAHLTMLRCCILTPATDPLAWCDSVEAYVKRAKLLLSAIEGARTTKEDPDQWLAPHLIKCLTPECCCAVCETLREFCEEGASPDEQQEARREG